MTCIVGYEDGGHIWMGGDSLGCEPDSGAADVRSDKKVFLREGFIIGFTSSFRMGQLLMHASDWPTPPDDPLAMHGFMCVEFVNFVRGVFIRGKYGKVDGDLGAIGGQFLVGVKGHLYTLESDYSVSESLYNFAAAGAGADLARGALSAMDGHASLDHIPARERVVTALTAAEKFNAFVRGPFVVEKL